MPRSERGRSTDHGIGPLSAYSVMVSSALDEVREVVPRVFAPHHTMVLERGRDLRAVLNAAQIGDATLGYLHYGAEIRLLAAPLTSCYHINLPIRGFTESVSGRECITTSPQRAAIFSPGGPTEITWSSGCAQLAIKLDRAAVQSELEKVLGRQATALRFDLGMDLTRPRERSWGANLRFILAEMDRPGSVIREPRVSAQWARLLISTLLFAQPHNHTQALDEPAEPVRRRAVREVIDLIDAHPDRSYSAGDLAAHANVSLRALQAGFRRHVSMSPMTYLTEVRLSRVHDELLRAESADVTITEVAHRWGFAHLGRFASSYRQKFGTSPSETLRRAR